MTDTNYENRRDCIHITPPAQPIHQLKTPLLTEEARKIIVRHGCTLDALLTEEARKIIVRHGCTLDENADECMVSFPEGTTRTEILPRMMTERYCITFPDNYELQEVYDKYREISVLLYPRE